MPVIMFFLIAVLVLFFSGENFNNIKATVTEKITTPPLIGYAYNENNYGFIKWYKLQRNDQYDIVALGSSRVLQFRQQMFNGSFYNAGFSIKSINDFQPFLESIPSKKKPRNLIIGLDQWMFNASWDNLSVKPSPDSWEKDFKFWPDFPTIKATWMDLISNKYTIASVLWVHHETIGLNAIINQRGIRNDGSFSYGTSIANLLKSNFLSYDSLYADTYNRIESGANRFEYGSTVNIEAINVLDKLLAYCKTENIRVFGFLPPFAEKVFVRIKKSGKYGYMMNLNVPIQKIFKKYKFEFYDFTDINSCHSDDSETIDGFHGGEKTYARILLMMASMGSQLPINGMIRKDIDHSINRYAVY